MIIFLKWLLKGAITLMVLNSCANTSEKSLEKISVGMDKAMVLDIVGDPKSTDRQNSTDEWLYPYYSDGLQKYKKIFFRYGKVTKIKPYDPSDEDLPGTYNDYKKKVESERQEKNNEFKDLND